MIVLALDTPRLAKRDPSHRDGRASPGAASQGWNVIMVLSGNNETIRKYTLDTTLPALREGSRRDPGASPLATSQGYTWGLTLAPTRPATRAWLRGNPQVSPAAASQGLDLSRPIHGAGGIAGLLAVEGTQGTYQGTYWFFYDAEPLTRRTTRSVGAAGPRAKPARRVKGNGNLTQVLDATDTNNISIAAHYEYDPYGNVITSSGPYKDANPIRFSTKWFDEETHLGYWGYRYYSPRLGRWLSRDPIGETGGPNLHAFLNNGPQDGSDPQGLCPHGATIWAADKYACIGLAMGPNAMDVVNDLVIAWYIPTPMIPLRGFYRFTRK